VTQSWQLPLECAKLWGGYVGVYGFDQDFPLSFQLLAPTLSVSICDPVLVGTLHSTHDLLSMQLYVHTCIFSLSRTLVSPDRTFMVEMSMGSQDYPSPPSH